MTEETRNAAMSGSIGIIMAIGVSSVLGWFLILGLLFSIQDLDATLSSSTGQPVAQIFLDTVGQKGAIVLMVFIYSWNFERHHKWLMFTRIGYRNRGNVLLRVCFGSWHIASFYSPLSKGLFLSRLIQGWCLPSHVTVASRDIDSSTKLMTGGSRLCELVRYFDLLASPTFIFIALKCGSHVHWALSSVSRVWEVQLHFLLLLPLLRLDCISLMVSTGWLLISYYWIVFRHPDCPPRDIFQGFC